VGKPRVAYRETITKASRVEVVFDRMLGGKPQYARVVLEVLPAEPDEGSPFETMVRPQILPQLYADAVRVGVLESLDSGPLAGYQLVGVHVRLLEATTQPDLSSEIAFKAAGAQAFRQAVETAGPVLLEPVMSVEVVMPEGFVGDVLGDLSARGATIQMMEARAGGLQAVHAESPLAKMFGYATDLRSLTQGRGTFSMELHHYAPVDSRQMEAILYGA
jgi:elongation factor G